MVTNSTQPAVRHSLPEPTHGVGGENGSAGRAVFSPCGRYRWWLERVWEGEGASLLFIGLNPSRADAHQDDPTLRRLMGFARRWGFSGLEVLNLFGGIAVHPAALKTWSDPVGADNDAWLRRRLGALPPRIQDPGRFHTGLPEAIGPRATGPRLRPEGPLVWLGWGGKGGWLGRDRHVLELLRTARARLSCLGTTRGGQPRHPLYCRSGLCLRPFEATDEAGLQDRPAPCHANPVATRSI